LGASYGLFSSFTVFILEKSSDFTYRLLIWKIWGAQVCDGMPLDGV
jgi:hypothetical protein